MAYRPAVSTLQASTIDILNVIRANASAQYQDLVPEVTKTSDISKVGDIFQGYPAFANEFLNALVNRIALVKVSSAIWSNPYAVFKKGVLNFGETIEDIFVGIANVREYSAEKGAEREFKRTIPDVRASFYVRNWTVQYPVTIEELQLRTAFQSMDGVQDLISRIVEQLYVAQSYDDFLLTKYMLIKSITKGHLKPVTVGDGSDLELAAKQLKSIGDNMTFMKRDYNEAGVLTSTPRDRLVVFLTTEYNAAMDIDVLAKSFNISKSEFMGKLFLIDDFTSFDNNRFAEIRANCDMLEEVTAEELALMANVKGVIMDSEWFQIYLNQGPIMTEQYCASGMYWNYFYNVWETFAHSPYANAVVLATDNAINELPATYEMAIADKSENENAVVLSFHTNLDTQMLYGSNFSFVQTQAATEAGIAIHKYGTVMIPASAVGTGITLEIDVDGTIYRAQTTINGASAVGDTVTFVPVVAG